MLLDYAQPYWLVSNRCSTRNRWTSSFLSHGNDFLLDAYCYWWRQTSMNIIWKANEFQMKYVSNQVTVECVGCESWYYRCWRIYLFYHPRSCPERCKSMRFISKEYEIIHPQQETFCVWAQILTDPNPTSPCTLHWRHIERDGDSNHWRLDGLLNRLF